MIRSELEFILLILTFLLLSIGSWQDLKTREVADWIWFTMISIGIIIHILQIILLILTKELFIGYVTSLILNFIFALTISLFLTFSGLGGEADRVAFIALGIVSPISQPIFVLNDPIYEIIIESTPRILGIFFNSYLMASLIPLIIFCYNLSNNYLNPDLYLLSSESRWKRLFIRFIGYPRQTQNLINELKEKPWHYDFLEEFNEEVGWYVVFRARLDTPEMDISRKKELVSIIQSKEKDFIWMQPSLPFILILTIGYLTEIFIGNVLLLFMVLLV
ncbi:MAG: A24 family peptidase C-terminal domain-containing protein [Promethearchaeota archaeon]